MNKNNTNSRKENPLSTLYQISEYIHPGQREALHIITNILDDIEGSKTIRDTLNDIIIKNEALGLNIVNQLEALLQGLKKEHYSRLNRE